MNNTRFISMLILKLLHFIYKITFSIFTGIVFILILLFLLISIVLGLYSLGFAVYAIIVKTGWLKLLNLIIYTAISFAGLALLGFLVGKIEEINEIEKIIKDKDIAKIEQYILKIDKYQNIHLTISLYFFLKTTKNQSIIDLICREYYSKRNSFFNKIVTEQKWIASKPLKLKIFTIIKHNFYDLINDDEKEIQYLILTIEDKDKNISDNAKNILKNIKISNQSAINFLCQQWVLKNRDTFLESLIVKYKYQATYPLNVKILTALKNERLEKLNFENPEEIGLVLECCNDFDSQIAYFAKQFTSTLKSKESQSLFYFLTEQWDKYESIDFDQTIIKSIFKLGSTNLKEKIIHTVKKSGRGDWLSIILGDKNINVNSMSNEEWITTLDILEKNNDYKKMWQLAKKSPPFWTQKLLMKLNLLKVFNQKEGFKQIEKLIQYASLCQEKDIDFEVDTILIYEKKEDYWNHDYNIFLISKKINISAKTTKSNNYNHNAFLKIYLRNLLSEENITILSGHTSIISCLAINDEGSLLASGSSNYVCRVTQRHDPRNNKPLPPNFNPDSASEIVHESTYKLSGGKDEQLHNALQKYLPLHSRKYYQNPIVSEFKYSFKDNSIKIWSLPLGQNIATFDGHGDDINCLAMNQKGTLLASASKDKTIKIWDLLLRENIKTIYTFKSNICSLAINDKGTVLASLCTRELEIKVWKLPSGKNFLTLKHDKPPSVMIMNLAGTLLISAEGSSINVWDLSSGIKIATLLNHTGTINHLDINDNSTILISASSDQTIRLWSLPLGKNFETIKEKNLSIISLTINNKGDSFAYFTSDSILKIYELKTLSFLACSSIQDILSQTEWINDCLQRENITENQRNWLNFILELVDYHRRFQIDLEDAPIIGEAGEFDIDIEE